jgi:ketosteroid isomerase-like protein
MPEENVEIVRRLYQAMEARDVEALPDLGHPDAEWIHDRRVGKEPIRGLENMIRYFTDMDEMFGELHTEPERFWDAGDRVLAFVRVTGSGQASGAGFEIRIAHIWTVHDGLIVRGEGYGDRDEALEAAGLSE